MKHWVSPNGTTADEKLWEYSAVNNTTTVTTSVRGPDQTRAERTLLAGSGSIGYGFEDAWTGRAKEERTYNASNVLIRRTLTEWAQTSNNGAHRNPRPTKRVEILLDTGGNALAATRLTQYDADLNPTVVESYDYVSVDPSTAQTGAISAFPPGALLRREEATYLVNDPNIAQTIRDAYRARNLLGLPTQKLVRKSNTGNPATDVVAAAEFKYDEAAYAPLNISVTVPGWTDPATTYRGTVTTTRSWLNRDSNNNPTTYPNGQWLEVHAQTDKLGNPRFAWDALGHMSEVRYDDSFSDGNNTRNTFAYPSKVITPVPDPSGAKGSSTAFESTTVYDFPTGRTISSTDANSKTTTWEYEPLLSVSPPKNSLNRVKKITQPDGGETVFEYGDTPGSFYVRSQTKLNATTWSDAYTYLDGMARPKRAAAYVGPGARDITDTEYDNQGRAWRSSNPYRDSSSNPASPSGLLWTSSTFDALNRVLTVTTPDGAVVTSNYSGNVVTVTDQAGKARRSESDAAGRLLKVTEDPAGLNYDTLYEYDAPGNLTKVTQGSQLRDFIYDSLKRLTSATNPESGTISYKYAANGNLLEKTDARGVTSTLAYDNLNRVTSQTFNQYLNGSAGSFYYYDDPDPAKNGKGRARYSFNYTYGANGELKYSYIFNDSYDVMGRPLARTQKFLTRDCPTCAYYTKDYTTTRSYDLAGNVTAQTYPSGRSVSYGYDTAARLTSFSGNLGTGGAATAYATNILYNPAGQMTKEQFGTAITLYHNRKYNLRHQLYDLRVGSEASTDWTWNRGAISFYYDAAETFGGSGTTNNGNVLRMDYWAPMTEDYTQWHATYQRFTYDSLNRLQQAQERAVGHNETDDLWWVQQFSYDRWGNRQINATETKSWTLVNGVRTEIQTEINEKQFQILTGNNRLKAPTDTNDGNETNDQMRYDPAGNLIRNEYTSPANPTREFLFDSGGRIGITRDNAGTELARYVYDPDGARVRRIIRNGQGNYDETWLVYGLGGELVAEYANNVTAGSPTKEYGYRGGELLIVTNNGRRSWLVQDHLGSTRMVLDESGRLTDDTATPTVNEAVIRHDFLPFGEEVPATAGRRTAAQGYGISNDPRQKFTGYERDDESGLDFAQARYYASVQGRFASPDPLLASGQIADPQSWNRYSYVGNRPTIITDPSGLLWYYYVDALGYRTYAWFESEADARRDTARTGRQWHVIVGNLTYIGVNGHLITLFATGGSRDWGRIRRAEVWEGFQGRDVDNAMRVIKLYLAGAEIGVAIGTAGASEGVIISARVFGRAAWEIGKDKVKDLLVGKSLDGVMKFACFAVGTPVWTSDGMKLIEEIQAGDQALSWNLEEGEAEYKTVVRTFIRQADELLLVTVEGEAPPLKATVDHPFFVFDECRRDQGRWVVAGQLIIGDKVRCPSGEWRRVIRLERQAGRVTVYNFEVAQAWS